jgi:tRNA(His) 5'-end guanylyltransferase
MSTEHKADWGNKNDPIAKKMKAYEATYATHLNSDKWVLVRLDGHKFSTFTRSFDKPYDPR